MEQQVTDIGKALVSLSEQMKSMQEIIDNQNVSLHKITRTSQYQQKEIHDLTKKLKQKDKEINILCKRLSKYEEPPKNSENGSTPPSKENMKSETLRRTKSLRKPTGKNSGGQEGNEGNTLKKRSGFDVRTDEEPVYCTNAASRLTIVKPFWTMSPKL